MQRNNNICISAGGTGGHIFPAVALAERMLKFGWDVDFITDQRGKILRNSHDLILLIKNTNWKKI